MPSILYLVTEDWFFCSHFLPMARAARQAGYEVAVATRIADHGAVIEKEGFALHGIDGARGSLAPLGAARTVRAMADVIRRIRPDIVHCIALRQVVLGGLAARLVGHGSLVLAPTGLGTLWARDGLRERMVRGSARLTVRLLARGGARFLFENPEDPRELGLDATGANVTLVGGSGVDPDALRPMPEPRDGPLNVAIVGRMLTTKGIAEAVDAIRKVREGGRDVVLHLYGAPDPDSPDTIAEAVLHNWAAEDGIMWHGRVADIAGVWAANHVALLLSRREGLPRALVEAAACGRPLVASDVAGCREVVLPERTGLLVPLGDIGATAAALARLHDEPDTRRRMGAGARDVVLERFTEARVADTVLALYREALSDG